MAAAGQKLTAYKIFPKQTKIFIRSRRRTLHFCGIKIKDFERKKNVI